MIYMGPLARREKEKEIQRDTRIGGSNAAGGFQWSIIDGLLEHLPEGFTVINAPGVGTWPRYYSRALLKNQRWQLGSKPCYEVGCVNLPVLKQWTRYLGTRKLVRDLRNEDILLCTAYMPFLWALWKLDRSNKLTMIVTDIPEYADMHRVSKIRQWLRKVHNVLVYRYMERVDRFVLLTEQMAGPLRVGDRPYIVMEGICGISEDSGQPEQRSRAVFYSGRLNGRYGLQGLLDAFQMIRDETVELWICGTGEMEDAIKSAADRDRRIRFFGFLPRQEVLAMQRRASLLVNPRQGREDFTKYSFPSKTMEYLASGTPVLMYKLEGIPDSYDAFLHYVPGDTAGDLAAAMTAVLNADPKELEEKARAAQQFVLEEKNASVQAQRILDLMERT